MSKWEELEKAARAATPGSWVVGSSPYDQSRHIYGEFPVSDGEESWLPLIASTDDDEVLVNHEANARYIAAANPSAILELLTERDALKAANEFLEEINEQLREQNDSADKACAEYEAELDRIRAKEPFAEVRLNMTGGNAGLSTHIVQLAKGYYPAGTKLYTLEKP